MLRLCSLCMATVVAIAAHPATAEVLVIDKVEQAPENAPTGVERPSRGASMDGVRSRFGDPEKIVPAVGEPPITRWVYDNFTVFFEHDRVLHSVIHRD